MRPAHLTAKDVGAGFKPAPTRLFAYLSLTKPTIQLLVVLTGAAALIYEGSLLDQPLRFGLILLLLAGSAGSAKALNQYFERGVDALMDRTRQNRPLPQEWISPLEAVVFATVLGLTSITLLWILFTPWSALLAGGTILFYSLFYTAYLKPRTYLSIVIGGVAGGMGPFIAWAATGAPFSPVPFLMLLTIFCWTPPHFWSLAYCHREDYRKAGYPMLPNLVSEARFWWIVVYHTLLTVAASFTLLAVGAGKTYLAAAFLLGGLFLGMVWQAKKEGSREATRVMFRYSMVYLVGLFAALVADRFLTVNPSVP